MMRLTVSLGALCATLAGARAQSPEVKPQGGGEAQQEVARSPYDPTQGVESDGSIPDRKPEGLPHRERWRYVPEGRLKPGNVFDRFLVSSFIAPVLFREEDIGTGGGVAITDTDFRARRRQEFANMVFTYSTEGQQAYRAIWRRWPNHRDVDGGGVVFDERTFVDLRGGYTKTLTRRFFGLGERTLPVDESSFTDEVTSAAVFWQQAVPEPAADWIVRLGATVEHHNLARGRVSGVPSTDDAYRPLFAAGDDRDLLWLTGGIAYDTRDSLHNPYRGGHLTLGADAAWHTGGEAGAVVSLSAGQLLRIPPLLHDGGSRDEEHPPTDVLAVGGFVSSTIGELPFYSLPSLGGSHTLRGFVPGRFTGEHAWHAGAEYRLWAVPRGFPINESIRVERLGLALFYEVGSVDHELEDLFAGKVHQSYGIGFRMSLERSALFRIDLGWSREDFNFTIGYGLTF